MPVAVGPSKRQVLLIVLASTLLGSIFIYLFRNASAGVQDPDYRSDFLQLPGDAALGQTSLSGHAIAPKLGNETAKQELGRAAWKLLHTTMARFPENPTTDESAALKSYVHLFQRLYPCGECAEHFGQILAKYPPQVASRNAAAAWACHVHNEVNKSLKKEIFDCANIGDFYDCGCADDEVESGRSTSARERPDMSSEMIEKLHTNGRDFNTDLLADMPVVNVKIS